MPTDQVRHAVALAIRALVWLLLGAIVIVTLVPVGMRPRTPWSADGERFVAYLLLGMCFVLAYPRRLRIGIVGIAAAAIGLELLQLLAATRDARLVDALVKVAGGEVGIALGTVLRFVLGSVPRL